MKKLSVWLVLATSAYAQTFEVVSIKSSPPPEGGGMSVMSGGGPGSKDPSRWRCVNMSLSNIVSNAFDLRVNEMRAPAWMDDARFDITAQVPDGATKADLVQMQRNMLVERFGLKFHYESKEVQGYDLVVAKGGPKFKESGPEPPPNPEASAPPKPGERRAPTVGADGFPVLPPGMFGMTSMRGKARSNWPRTSIELMARNLSYQVEKPIVDATGLTGKYDISLYWVTENLRAPVADSASEPAGPNIFTAVQEQLGLKLEPKKVTIQVLVVDDAMKVPTEN